MSDNTGRAAGNVAELSEIGATCAWAWQAVEEWPTPADFAEARKRAQVVDRLRQASRMARDVARTMSRSAPPAAASAQFAVQFDDVDAIVTIHCFGRTGEQRCRRAVSFEKAQPGFVATAAAQAALRDLGWRTVTTGTGRAQSREWRCAAHADEQEGAADA